jgi:hypothetical protein
MAVDETKIPWTYSAEEDVDAHVGRIPIHRIDAYNTLGVAASIIVKDKAGGRTLFVSTVGSGEAITKTFPPGFFAEGIYIDTLASGEVSVWPRGHGYG